MTDKPQAVRLATRADEQEIFDILTNELYTENALFSFDPEKVRAVIKKATDRKGGILGVIDGQEGIEAILGMEMTSLWYSSDYFICEMWNFVREPYRKSEHAKTLIEFAKWCSESMNLPLQMGILTTSRLAAKERLYRRMLPKIGAFFAYNFKNLDKLLQPEEVN